MTQREVQKLHEALRQEDAKIAAARAAHGVWLDTGPDGGMWVYVDGGKSYEGSPVVHARKAGPLAIDLWAAGRVADLAAAVSGEPAVGRGEPAGGVPFWPRGWPDVVALILSVVGLAAGLVSLVLGWR